MPTNIHGENLSSALTSMTTRFTVPLITRLPPSHDRPAETGCRTTSCDGRILLESRYKDSLMVLRGG